jgi:hypothetical protein
MDFSSKSFVDDVRTHLREAKKTLAWFVDAYNWASGHLGEIRRASPGFTLEWLRTEIKRIFNADPLLYSKTAAVFGGGRTPAEFDKGRKIIHQVGLGEAARAARIVHPAALPQIAEKIGPETSVHEFRTIVDEAAKKRVAEAGEKPRAGERSGSRVDYREEYFRLLRENSALKAALKKARAELADALKKLGEPVEVA